MLNPCWLLYAMHGFDCWSGSCRVRSRLDRRWAWRRCSQPGYHCKCGLWRSLAYIILLVCMASASFRESCIHSPQEIPRVSNEIRDGLLRLATSWGDAWWDPPIFHINHVRLWREVRSNDPRDWVFLWRLHYLFRSWASICTDLLGLHSYFPDYPLLVRWCRQVSNHR